MKRLLFIFLLASAPVSAQLVLPICSPQLPCPGFPLGSVQAGVDQNGWRNFKLTLTQNVTLFSFVGVPPPSQASVNVIFTQDATGGRTVTFAPNITNPCTITAAANATTLCQFEYDGTAGVWFAILGGGGGSTPGGANNSVQFNSSGTLGGVSLGAGQLLVGTSGALIAQNRAVIDARDIGVDCTGATNSDAALANLATTDFITSKQLQFPNGCNVHVQNTILVKNQASFSIIGVSRPGAAGKGATITCVTGGTCNGNFLVDMEFVAGFEVAGLTLDANGLASESLHIDKNGSGAVYNTTDGLIHDMAFNVKGTGGGAQSWIGLSLSEVSTSNVEDMRVTDSAFFCNARPSNAQQYGVRIFNSSNAKGEVVRHNNFTTCFYDVWSQQGNVKIEENEFSSSGGACATGTGSDIRVDGNTDVDVIEWNLDENGTQFFNCDNDANLGGCNTSFMVSIRNNHFAPAGCENTGVYWINTANSSNPMEIRNNAWDGDVNLLKVIGSANTIVRPLYVGGNTYPNQLFTPWWTEGASQASPGSGETTDYGLLMSNKMFAGAFLGQSFPSPFVVWRSYSGASNHLDFALQNVNNTFLIKSVQNNTNWVSIDGTQSQFKIGQLATAAAPTISNQGTTGATSYTYAIVAFVASSGCTGGFNSPGSTTTTTATGNATLTSTNFNQLQWIPTPGASEYGIWRTASSGTPSSTGKIGCFTAIQNSNTNLVFESTAYPVNQVIVNTNYQFNDTGLAGDSSALPATNTAGQFISTTPTGLAPFSITSTTPVSNLTTVPATYNHSGTQQTGAHIVEDSGTLAAGTLTVTFTGSAVFTSSTSFACTATDSTATNALDVTYTSGSSVTFNGTTTDTFRYICIGN